MFEHAIFVPVTPTSEAVTNVIKRNFAQWFGGFSVIKVDGGWVDVLGRLIEEPVLVIGTVISHKSFDTYNIIRMAKLVKFDLEQESVLVIVNKQPEFV